MFRYEKTIETAAPPSRVFDFVSNIDRRPEWQLHLKAVERLTEGPVAVGFQFRDVGKFGPATLEVIRHTPPSDLSYKAVGGPFDVRVDMTLSEDGAGSALTVAMQIKPLGFMRLVWPVMRLLAIPQIRKDFDELEKAVANLS